MEHQPFTIAQMRPIRDCMTVSRPANLGKEVPVTWFSLGAGTTPLRRKAMTVRPCMWVLWATAALS